MANKSNANIGFENDRDAYEEKNVFYVPEEARWATIASAAHTPEIGVVIDTAMRAIETDNKKLKNVLPKNYASPDLDKRVLGNVVDLFTNNINMDDAIFKLPTPLLLSKVVDSLDEIYKLMNESQAADEIICEICTTFLIRMVAA